MRYKTFLYDVTDILLQIATLKVTCNSSSFNFFYCCFSTLMGFNASFFSVITLSNSKLVRCELQNTIDAYSSSCNQIKLTDLAFRDIVVSGGAQRRLMGLQFDEGLEEADEGKIDGRRQESRASMKRSKVSGVFALRARLVQVQPLPRLCSPLQQQHTWLFINNN